MLRWIPAVLDFTSWVMYWAPSDGLGLFIVGYGLYGLTHEVKVEKVGEEFLVRVTCKKGQDVLVSILEAFEEMGLNVLQARVSCNYFLNIEAIVKAQDQGIDVREITQAVHKAIGKQDGEGTQIL
ncbi:hypothetical protein TEA_009615 [Camellia sinensis var. sinensis]|uniref:Plant bHLH transcription factor ACT-like domain-containing protein n=1 Tax=Camellia sinensis var. sinensis TaxID=542762 RepID=A0A4S4DY76_CAMSN|nr:hypothetical protein TEA_009615 [Camellia sinensis var. sinensis]